MDAQAIADLLSQSRAAHSAYQFAKQQRRLAEARSQLSLAAETRRDAHAADPDHLAPAWESDAIPGDHATASHAELHDSLTEFYREQLAR